MDFTAPRTDRFRRPLWTIHRPNAQEEFMFLLANEAEAFEEELGGALVRRGVSRISGPSHATSRRAN